MSLFLASSLYAVGDVVNKHINMKWKRVGCIWNAAHERWWKNARWNIWDKKFFEASWSPIIDIDISWSVDWDKVRDTIDILFVGWWDTLYLRDLSEQSWLHTSIRNFLEKWWVYMGTSAGSMLACRDVYYPHEGRKTNGLGLFPICLIPHRWSPAFLEDRENNIKKMNNHGQSYLMLTDIDVIIVHDEQRNIEKSKEHTLEEVFQKAKEME